MDNNTGVLLRWPNLVAPRLWVLLTGIPILNFIGWGVAAYRYRSFEYGFASACIGVLNFVTIIWFAMERIPSIAPVFLCILAIAIYPLSFMDAVVTERVYGRFMPGRITTTSKLTRGFRGGWGRWWIVWTALPVMNVFAWLLAAIRYRSFKYILWAVFYSIPLAALIIEPPNYLRETFWTMAFFATYLLGMIHALLIRDPVGEKDYVRGAVGVPVMGTTRIYSPTQAGFGSLFGPMAATYFVWNNFRSLGRPAEAKLMAVWGVFFNVIFIVFLLSITSITPIIVVLLCYALTVRIIVQKLQLVEKQVAESSGYSFQSNETVLLMGFSGLALNLIFVLLVFFIEYLFAR